MTKKTLLSVFAVLIAGTLIASAGLLTYYGKVETTANVSQSVLLDGNDYNAPIEETIDAQAGCCYCYEHYLENNACVEAPIDIQTSINAHGKGPSGIDIAYRSLDWIIGDSDYNGVNNVYEEEPYFTWTIDGNEIALHFYNPTTWQAVFDYRVDGESGEDHEWTQDTISEGPCAGEKFGQEYNPVVLQAGQSVTKTITPCHDVWVGMRQGAEQMCYIPWIHFEMPELTAPLTLQPGEHLDFLIQYCFDVSLIPGQYDITTTIVPN